MSEGREFLPGCGFHWDGQALALTAEQAGSEEDHRGRKAQSQAQDLMVRMSVWTHCAASLLCLGCEGVGFPGSELNCYLDVSL